MLLRPTFRRGQPYVARCRFEFSRCLATFNCSNSISQANNADVVIVGAGIAGICSAHYLLQKSPHISVTILDKEETVANVTSRINGGLICPSLSNSWTNYPIFSGKDSMLKMAMSSLKDNGKEDSLLTFDTALLQDKRFWTFVLGWLRRKPFMRSQSDAISRIGILSMKCFNDPEDAIIQSLEFDRAALGTRTADGTFGKIDSSGDIHMFCSGLYDKLIETYPDQIHFAPSQSVESFICDKSNSRLLEGVTTRDINGNCQKWTAQQFVIAAGNQSYELCRSIGINCPIFPVKGYIVVFSSEAIVGSNLQLKNKSFVSPIGRGTKYHLSGCADFTSRYKTADAFSIDEDRVGALIKTAKESFPDLTVRSIHCGYRPLSPDDTPLIGSTSKFDNLFINTGAGSKGWTQGPGSGKLLADIMLDESQSLNSEAYPYRPTRFELW